MVISNLISQINSKKQELDSLGKITSKDEQRLWEKLRLEWNYNSNHIEGNTLTYGETKLLLIFGQTNGNHNVRDLDEMRAHDVAIQLIRDWSKDENYTLTERDIRELNQTILVQDFWKEAVTPSGQQTRRKIKIGNYKEHPNSVITTTGELFEYASVSDTPILMKELIDWYRNETSDIHPVTVAAMLHYRFVRIHPFDDGNGRISRILLNFHLLKNGYPPIVIKSTDKKNYLLALNRADAGDLDAFVEYVGNELLWSLDLNIKAAKGESIEEEEDFKKKIALLNKKVKAIEAKEKKEIFDSKSAAIKFIENDLGDIINRFCEKMSEFNSLFISSEYRFISSMHKDSTSRNSNTLPIDPKGNLNYVLEALKKEDVSLASFAIKIEWYLIGFKGNKAKNLLSGFELTLFPDSFKIKSIATSENTKYDYSTPSNNKELLYKFIDHLINTALAKIEKL